MSRDELTPNPRRVGAETRPNGADAIRPSKKVASRKPPSTPAEKLGERISESNAKERALIALRMPLSGTRDFTRLAHDKSEQVRLAVASRPDLPAGLVEQLLRDPSAKVRLQVSKSQTRAAIERALARIETRVAKAVAESDQVGSLDDSATLRVFLGGASSAVIIELLAAIDNLHRALGGSGLTVSVMDPDTTASGDPER